MTSSHHVGAGRRVHPAASSSARLVLLLLLALPLVASAAAASNGAGLASSFARDLYGPSSDLFSRPTEGVLVLIDGSISPEEQEAQRGVLRDAPVLLAKAADVLHRLDLQSAAAHLPEADIKTLAALGSLSDHVQSTVGTGEVFAWRFDGSAAALFVQPSKREDPVAHHVVLVDEGSGRLAGELKVLGELVAQRVEPHKGPRIVVAVLGGLASMSSPSRAASLAQLASGLVAVQAELGTSRPLFQVAFTGYASTSTMRRALVTTANTTAAFAGADYVIFSWTVVVLGLLVFVIFCCIPWAPTLDPILRTTMKAAGTDSKMQ
jgi:hypothetical protein